MIKRSLVHIVFFLSAAICLTAAAQNKPVGKSWIASDFPANNDSYGTIEQAKRWALCAATLDLYADATEATEASGTKTNTVQAIRNLANGAEASVMAVILIGSLKDLENASPEQMKKTLSARIKYSQVASDEFPAAARTTLLSQLENTKDKDQFAYDLDASAANCIREKVLEIQETYVNMVRELAMRAN